MKRILPLFLLLFGTFALAQQTGNIVGTVHDASGAVVPDASVKITNTETQFQRVIKTNGSGEYVAPSMPTGTYSITVDKAGFQKLNRTGIILTGATTVTVELQVAVGSDAQTVEVTSQLPLLQAQGGTVSNLVDSQQMVDLPLATRNFANLVLLTPGAHAGTSSNLNEGASAYAIRGGANYSINGSIAAGNSYLIDGLYNRNQWLNSQVFVPIVDSIKEYRVLTSNFPAEFGEAAGAVTTVTTKNGTNHLHGNVWSFFRDQLLNANDYFLNQTGTPRPAYRRNTFGGTLGGPILHDKLFFFADYQGIRQAQPSVSNVVIPTQAQVAQVETGDFSSLLTAGCGGGAYTVNSTTGLATCNSTGKADPEQLYNPYTGTATARQPFANNNLSAYLDPAATKLFKLLPPPNYSSSGSPYNYIISPLSTLNDDQFDIRLDENLGAADLLYFKYSLDHPQALFPGSVYTVANAPFKVGPYIGYGGDGYTGNVTTQSGTLGYSHIFTPTLLLEAHAGILRWFANETPLDTAYPSANDVGIQGINYNPLAGGLSAVTITGFAALGDNSTNPEDSRITTFQYDGDLIKTSGNHTIKAGVQFIRQRFNGYSSFPVRGSFDFNGQFTSQIASKSTSYAALPDFAIGAEDNANRNILEGEFGMRYFQLGFYAEDTWRATERLSLEYGLRYDIDTPPYEVHNHWANLNLHTGLLEVAGINGAGRTLRNTDYNTFQPRVGFAYTLDSSRNTVLRSGFGISYVNELIGGSQLYKNLPYFFAQTVATTSTAAPPTTLSKGFPTPVAPDPTNAAAISTGSPTAWNKNNPEARSIQYSLGVQHNFRGDVLGELSYVGSRGEHLMYSNLNIDQSAPGPGAQNPRRPFYAINPNLTAINYRTGAGDSHYDSMQARLERRMSKGISFGASYTLSHFLTDVGDSNGQGGNGNVQNVQCLSCNYGPSPNDYRHVLVFNHTLELPFGRGRRMLNKGPLSYLVGPWDFAGIWTIRSGGHSTVFYSTNVSNSSGGRTQRPNRIGSGNLPAGKRTLSQWFDTTAFAAPAQYTFGNSGTGIIAGPGYFNVDLTLERHFVVREHIDFDLRGEAFNAFNRANFDNPNTTIGNAQAGTISSAGSPRVGQVALKVAF